MISDEWHVDDERKPFAGAQKDDIHDNMKHILGKHQLRGKIIAFGQHSGHRHGTTGLRPCIHTYRVQTVALVDGIFVVGLQLIEDNHMEYREENQHRISDQRNYVRHSGKVEGHFGWREVGVQLRFGEISKGAVRACPCKYMGYKYFCSPGSGSWKIKRTQIIMTSGFVTFVYL